jgi:electron transfer flavoprotein alpha subunit
MTAMANLGLISDAGQVLLRLAERLGIEAPATPGSPYPDRPAGAGAPDG